MTADAIDEYEAAYRGSAEEVADLVAHFARYGGCMANVTECVLFAERSDLHRFKGILDAQLEAGAIEPAPAYARFRPPPGPGTAEVVRRAKAKLQAAAGRARAGGDEASLFALIRGRQASHAEAHDAMVDALAAKYAPKPKGKAAAGGKAAGGGGKAPRGSPPGAAKQGRGGVHKPAKGKAAKGK